MESNCPKCGSPQYSVNEWTCGSYPLGDRIHASDLCDCREELAAANSEIERLRERDQKWQLEAFTALTAAEEEHSDEVISVVKTMLFRMGIEEPPCLT